MSYTTPIYPLFIGVTYLVSAVQVLLVELEYSKIFLTLLLSLLFVKKYDIMDARYFFFHSMQQKYVVEFGLESDVLGN